VNYLPAFKENFHMTKEQFDFIHSLIQSSITPKSRARPDKISSEEKLAMTLE
jgi:hypothetical protein